MVPSTIVQSTLDTKARRPTSSMTMPHLHTVPASMSPLQPPCPNGPAQHPHKSCLKRLEASFHNHAVKPLLKVRSSGITAWNGLILKIQQTWPHVHIFLQYLGLPLCNNSMQVFIISPPGHFLAPHLFSKCPDVAKSSLCSQGKSPRAPGPRAAKCTASPGILCSSALVLEIPVMEATQMLTATL